MAKSTQPFRIGIAPVDGFALMSYASTVEPLRAANSLSGQNLYDVSTVQIGPKPAISSGGELVQAQIPMKTAPPFDLVLLIAGGQSLDYQNAELAHWLRGLSRKGVQIGGVSAGPLLLARMGFLLNRRMTVHWEHVDHLAEVVPDAILEPSLYVIDRDRLTCGGGTAPIDLMLAMIANQHGQKLAQLVGDWFLHTSIRPSGGPQRSSIAQRYDTVNGAVLSAIEAIETHVANPLSLQELAQIAGVSERQLTRLFLAQLNKTPIAFGRMVRLEKARTLLKTATLSLSDIALMTGFSSAAHFSSSYSTAFGVPPSQARRKD